MIYLDNNATTRVAPEVFEALAPWFSEHYGNPSSLHQLGLDASDAIAAARSSIAKLVGARDPASIVFVSGGTEADHTALRAALSAQPGKRHIVTTAVEHSAVLEPARALAREGCELEIVPVSARGELDVDALLARVRSDTALVSVMAANNETGVLHDVAAVAAGCRGRGVRLHVDAVQACGKVPFDAHELGVDTAAFSSHKLHGPKGVGALYVRPGVACEPLIRGGPQENERRAGTENVPAIVGFGHAAKLARAWLASDGPARVAALRDALERGLVERVAGAHVHAGAVARVPNTTNLRFDGVSGEALVMWLSAEGVLASTGAACSSSRHRPSHVLLALGLAPQQASASVRFSLSRYTTAEEIDRALELVPLCVARLRELSGARAG